MIWFSPTFKINLEKPVDRAIVVFLGWGMDPNPFLEVSCEGYDIVFIHSYYKANDLNLERFLDETLRKYREIIVIGWSFGVRVATEVLQYERDLDEKRLPITLKLAVNGTPQHISNMYGIPERAFKLTLNAIGNEKTVETFRRRMCGDDQAYMQFMRKAPVRSMKSLGDELEMFGNIETLPKELNTLWDRAVVGEADAIIPAGNQLKAWSEVTTDVVHGMPHMLQLQQILQKYVIDKQRVATKFADASDSYADHATVQHTVARRLWQHVCKAKFDLSQPGLTILEVGAGTGALTQLYAGEPSESSVLKLYDIAGCPDVASMGFRGKVEEHCCDAETAFFGLPAGSVDAIFSASTIQWFNSPLQFIDNCIRGLRPGGLLALSFYGEGTFRELHELTGNSLPYLSLSAISRIPGAEVWKEETQLEFKNVAAMLRHLKLTGVNGLRGSNASTADAVRLLRNYPKRTDGSCSLTYNTFYLIFRKPTELS